jgi:glutamate formiminotransferase
VTPTLLAVPNVSEGRNATQIEAIGEAFDADLLDVHSDPDHHRTVFTLAGSAGSLAEAVTRGAREATKRIDLDRHAGVHPRVGAVDVAPIVYLNDADRGAACAEALVLGDMLGSELQLPVFLYGILANHRTRAELRRGGPQNLAGRIRTGELKPDFGPHQLHPTAGATLVAARPPLVAFNVEVDAPLATAKWIARTLRNDHVKALGLQLQSSGVVQVSTNIEDHTRTTAADVVAAVQRHARVTGAELVAPAPRAALAHFPPDVPLRAPPPLEDHLPS